MHNVHSVYSIGWEIFFSVNFCYIFLCIKVALAVFTFLHIVYYINYSSIFKDKLDKC